MRILHLSSLYAPYNFGGAELVVQAIAEGMAKRDFVTAVACLVPTPTPSSRLNGVEVFPLAHRNPLWIESSASYPSLIRNFSKIATLFNVFTAHDFSAVMDTYRPTVVHTHSMVSLTPMMWKIAKEKGAITVHTLHDFDLACIRAALFKNGARCNRQHLACSLFSKVKRSYHHYIDHVIGVSKSILDIHLNFDFFREFSDSRKHVIWNPIPSLHPITPKIISKNGAITFGFLGRLVPEKGINLLIDACRLIGCEGWKLNIAGRAPIEMDSLKAATADFPVSFLGFIDQSEFFSTIDVLVVPSIWAEPFGLTVMEAYSYGLPVLGADIAGTAEIIGAVDRNWLFLVDSARSLADKMREIIRNGREPLNRFTVPSAVLARCNPSYVCDQYARVYGV